MRGFMAIPNLNIEDALLKEFLAGVEHKDYTSFIKLNVLSEKA